MYLILMAAAAILAVYLSIRYVTDMPGRSHIGDLPPLGEVDKQISQRLRHHVEMLAGEIGERNFARPSALERAAQYIEKTLWNHGFNVANQEYDVMALRARNLEAEVVGAERPGDIVLVGAHYDSVVGCPGANDNATGVAAMLELAGFFVGSAPDRTIRFVAFVNEEPPFCFTDTMGSRVYSRRSRERGENIVAMLSLETIGYYSNEPRSQRYPFPFGLLYPRTGNFIGFVGNLSSRALVRRCVAAFRNHVAFPSEGAAAPGYLPGIYWSDHWSFWRERYRAVMVTDTALFRYQHYHTSHDTPDKVDHDRTARVVMGLKGVVEELAGVASAPLSSAQKRWPSH